MSKIIYNDYDIKGAQWDVIEFGGQKHMVRYFRFEPSYCDVIDGYAALDALHKILVDSEGDFVSADAADVDAHVSVYVPREIFYADESAFNEYIHREHYGSD